MKDKISIITWIGNGNFGTSLQSFALHEKLKELGYDVNILTAFSCKISIKNMLKSILFYLGFFKIKEIWRKKNLKSQSPGKNKLYKFQKEKYQIKSIFTIKQYHRLLNETKVFVTGSDQIWNAWYSYNPFYYLDFAGSVKRIAYASSIGTSDFPEQHKNQIQCLLSKFSHIGVREETAVSAISKLLNRKDIKQVLDPTFLLSASQWRELGKEACIEFPIPKNYILCYLLGNNPQYQNQLEKVISILGIDNIIIIPSVENPTFTITNLNNIRIYSDAGPLEFVKLIEHATVVCTDSFHATALSINLSKNFVEFLRFQDGEKISQNSRIYDLLNHFQLSDYIYNDNNNKWSEKIDYLYIQKILSEDRNKSISYLLNAIKN